MPLYFSHWLTKSLAFSTSLVVHLLLVVLLGLVFYPSQGNFGKALLISVSLENDEQLAAELEQELLPEEETDLPPNFDPSDELQNLTSLPDEFAATAEQLTSTLESPFSEAIPSELLADEATNLTQFVSGTTTGLPAFSADMKDVGGMEGAYLQARAEVAQALGADLTRLQSYKPEYIVVMRGAYDQIEQVLRMYKVPHTLVGNLTRTDLRDVRVLCINCGAASVHPQVLRNFVEQGGRVVSTDWGILNVQQAFPGQLGRARGTSRDDVVAVDLTQTEERLMKGVAGPDGRGSWWLESGSFFVEIRSGSVKPLVTSRDLARRYRTSDTVACLMSAGDGELLQLVSHVFLKDGDRPGLVAMHRLLFNFLLTVEPAAK